ncbi:hypothetical protein HF086_009791 [Spodoptera exigua]|uniref:Uncharacterized protein n=1 Tax=Spodoptera exigua TaxID=7107 RepID=A0A922MW50_SPOEX|nr:hypothetical protein HF086_009791 [Spodoptera exigua]
MPYSLSYMPDNDPLDMFTKRCMLENLWLLTMCLRKSGRHMKFPYTLSAKIAQYPLFFYMKNNWIWMYWPVGCLGSFYVFYKIHRLVNSEANVRSWAEVQRKNAEKEHH